MNSLASRGGETGISPKGCRTSGARSNTRLPRPLSAPDGSVAKNLSTLRQGSDGAYRVFHRRCFASRSTDCAIIMNDHRLLNTDASQFPSWGAVWMTSSVHGQHHWRRLATFSWQWVMPISQRLVRHQPHIHPQRSLKSYRDLTFVSLPRTGKR